MSYVNDFANAEKQGKTKAVAGGIFKLDEETPEIIGKVIGVETKTFQGLGKPTKVAVLDTDEGEALILAGVLVINFCEKPSNAGKLIRVRYAGKKNAGKPNEYNDYVMDVAE